MVKKMKVIIKTRKDNNEVTYEYNYDGDLNIPVTTLLERINHSHEKKFITPQVVCKEYVVAVQC